MAPPSPTSSSLSSENDIEMFSLDEINVSPKHYEPQDTAQSPPDDHDSDDDDDGGESGERALLGENTQTRWNGKPLSISVGSWEQTSGIVVEVSASSFRSSVSNAGPGSAQTLPTLFVTTLSSLFTGKLFSKISVCQAIFSIFCVLRIL